MKVFVNNKILPLEEAGISVIDRGFLYGDGIFETLRAYQGRLFAFDMHIERFRLGIRLLSLPLPYTAYDIRGFIRQTLDANELSEATVRVTLTRGDALPGTDMRLCKNPTLVIIAQPFTPYPDEYYQKGISVITADIKRNLKDAVNPQIKSLNFLNNIMAKAEATKAGATEALMLNHQGHLTEGTVSNVFFVKHDILHTPSVDCGILNGVTRQIVLDMAKDTGINTEEGAYTTDDLCEADEIFITNTTMEIMPVCVLNQTNYLPGPTTNRLRKIFKEQLNDRCD